MIRKSEASLLVSEVVAKEFGTTIVEDLALVQSCAFYMGMSSGPAAMANFCDKPMVIFNSNLDQVDRVGLERHEWGLRHVFATKHHRILCEPETTESLIEEFEALLSAVGIDEWKNEIERPCDDGTDRRAVMLS